LRINALCASFVVNKHPPTRKNLGIWKKIVT
jgi:hypothetical protein